MVAAQVIGCLGKLFDGLCIVSNVELVPGVFNFLDGVLDFALGEGGFEAGNEYAVFDGREVSLELGLGSR